MICICTIHKNCIILHFYSILHVILKKLFCSLDKNQNTKRPGFYTLQVIRVFLSFPQLKQLRKMKIKKLYCDYVSFRFLGLCFRVL